MLRLGWLLGVVLSLSINAQEVVVNPPLSIEPEAGQHLKGPVEGTLVPVKAEITVDGQLKLEDKKPEAPKSEASKADTTKVEESKPVVTTLKGPSTIDLLPLEKYLQFSFGYLNSKWEKADPALDNGSSVTDFRVVADMNSHNQFGFAIELISDSSTQSSPENVRAIQYKLFIDYHRTLFTDKLDYLLGLALSLGDYSIPHVKNGTLYGVIPSAGLRFYLVGRNSIDIAVEYHQYLSKPQSYIGGLALVPRFSFVF